MEQVWRFVPHCCNALAMTATRYDTLDERNVHSLRHRYATKVYAATHDLAAVQRLLGHASVATTQVYVAVADDVLTTAAKTAWYAPRLRAV